MSTSTDAPSHPQDKPLNSSAQSNNEESNIEESNTVSVLRSQHDDIQQKLAQALKRGSDGRGKDHDEDGGCVDVEFVKVCGARCSFSLCQLSFWYLTLHFATQTKPRKSLSQCKTIEAKTILHPFYAEFPEGFVTVGAIIAAVSYNILSQAVSVSYFCVLIHPILTHVQGVDGSFGGRENDVARFLNRNPWEKFTCMRTSISPRQW